MTPGNPQYLPFKATFLGILFVAIVVVVVLVELGILEYAYEKIGVHRRWVFLVLILSLLGSSFNIPVAQLPGKSVITHREVWFFGIPRIVPAVSHWPGTIIAVNVGGALIPVLLSLFLVVRNRLWLPAVIGTAAVAAITFPLATPVRGVGITMPIFVSPILAAGAALLLSRKHPAALAYVAGTLGTLIGADLLNLGHISGLGAPVASIGGAGTFDGIFVTGILAVLLA